MTDSTDQLEREIEASRSRLDATLSGLQDRLNPATIADELIGIGRRSGTGSDLYDLVLATVRRNPVPVLLVCAGAAWLISSMRRGAPANLHEPRSLPMQAPEPLPRRARARIYPAPR